MQQLVIENRLQDLMLQEINILRDILANLSQEQQALLSHDVERLQFIVQERLQFLEAYDKYDAKLLESTQELADLEHKDLPSLETLSHDEILEILQGLVSDDNLELRSRIDQLRAIHQEIHNKNDITRYFLEVDHSAQRQLAPQKKSKKIALELMEPNP